MSKRARDPRVERSLFSWWSYLVVLFAFAAVTAITFAFLFQDVDIMAAIPPARMPLAIANFPAVSALFTLLWGLWRRATTQKPVERVLAFTEAGGCVSVRLVKEGGRVRVSVVDTGCGVEPADATRIFDKFYQADPSRASAGNGLGLALVKRVVDLHEGAVRVKSVPDAGSTFTVILPEARNA